MKQRKQNLLNFHFYYSLPTKVLKWQILFKNKLLNKLKLTRRNNWFSKTMDLPDVVSLRKFKEFSKNQKEELYETLLELSEAIEDLPKKSIRKTLELSLAVLAYKGDQVKELEEQLEAKDKDSLGDII